MGDSKLRFNPSYLNRPSGPDLNWPDLLARITCPALLITADPALGSIVTAQQAAELQAMMPQLRVAHIAGAGHNIRRDQFEPYLETIMPQFAAWAGKS